MLSKTIFALSTPLGRSGAAIIRISGTSCIKVYQALCRRKTIEPRKATYSKIYDNQNIVDEIVAIYFKAPNSYTGEDILELQTHGAPTVIRKILSQLTNIPNCNFALPGEFSKRAFINNKTDILKAEGVNQLIHSDTELQRELASNQTFGKVFEKCNDWKKALIKISSYLDAFIDFSSDDSKIDVNEPKSQLEEIINDIVQSLNMYQKTRQIINGTKIVIFGPPNVGKSTFFNLINNEEKSIVTGIKGTTRDLIESTNEIKGNKATFIDTAGLRKTENLIERAGIAKTKSSLSHADLLILILSPDCYSKENIEELKKQLESLEKKKIVVVLNKMDIKIKKGQKSDWIKALPLINKMPFITTSCIKKEKHINIYDNIIDFIEKNLREDEFKSPNNLLFGELRHYDHLNKMKNHLFSAIKLFSTEELAAEEIRFALKELENILGVVDKETKLDLIFSKFCIGK